MPEDRYNVVFGGTLSAETTSESARRNLQAWFRLDDAQLENLFSGRRVVVKRGVSLDVASRFQAAFRKAGGLALIEPSVDDQDPEWSETTEGEDIVATAAEPATEATALTLASRDTPMEEIDDRGPPQSPDTSALSLVPGPEWSLEDCEPSLPPAPTFYIDDLELEPMTEPGPADVDKPAE